MGEGRLLFAIWLVNTLIMGSLATFVLGIQTLDELTDLILVLAPSLLSADIIIWGVWKGSR